MRNQTLRQKLKTPSVVNWPIRILLPGVGQGTLPSTPRPKFSLLNEEPLVLKLQHQRLFVQQ